MLALSTLALVICSVAVVLIPNGSSAQEFISNVNMSCPSSQTECTFGCCPFAEGVCCADGFECCQHGQTCIPFIGVCIGLEHRSGDGTSLVSSKSTPVESLITACPPGTTTCGKDKCCRYPDATCCSDGEHCCPNGFRCDLPHKICVKDSFNSLVPSWSRDTAVPVAKSVKKSPYKTCPGSDKICPSYSSCCITDDGQWGCCQNPSLSQLGTGGGECCDTLFGHMCCPDFLPKCSVYGCMAVFRGSEKR